MKTNFLQRNNKKKRFSFLITILLLVLVFFIPIFRNILFAMGKPVWVFKNHITSFVSGNLELLKSKSSLIKENDSLKEQIKSSDMDKSLSEIVKKENEDLKSLLNRSNLYQNQILSAVLVKPFLSPYDTLIIDVGLEDGISPGNKVLAYGTNFIGYVSEVYDNSSKVTLYSSYGEKVKVLIGQSYVLKEATGIGGGNFKVEMPKGIDVKEGDTISVPSISANIFAVVEKIESKDSDSFETVLFKSVVNMNELKWVQVIIPFKAKI